MGKECCKCKKIIVRVNKNQRVTNLCYDCYISKDGRHTHQLSKIKSLKK